ncbi:hypothetical protein HYT57_04390 [Candidatus Woesearchaeota archaeon]|nr:hypothetical protein [Candidatus Woesearchaeota archaeon]
MPRSMLEKLTEHYETMKKLYKNDVVGGHAVGFYRELDEIVQGEYEIPEGKFTIRSVYDDFFWWNYDPYDKKS